MKVSDKVACISPDNSLPIVKQCEILQLNRSNYYYDPKEAKEDTDLMNEIKEVWLDQPARGYRRVTDTLLDKGIKVNRKRVQRLMKLIGIRSCLPAPRFSTTTPNDEDTPRPYFLRNLVINRPNQVWATARYARLCC